MTDKTALILRATGVQGKATASYLLKAGWTVHAFVADPENARALPLKEMGAKLFKGALSDAASIESAIQGCSVLFLNQMPSFTDDAETREATAVLELAKQIGIKHIVHTTVLSLNNPDYRTKLASNPAHPAIYGKGDVEKLVRDSGIQWTIIRPGYFMTNLTTPISHYMFPELPEGKFISSYKPDTVLPLVDPDNIGAFAAAAFENPDKFGGKILSVASEKLAVKDIVPELARASGKEVEAIYRTDEETQKEIDANNFFVSGQLMSGDLAGYVDIEEVKSYGIALTSFRSFLDQQKAAAVS